MSISNFLYCIFLGLFILTPNYLTTEKNCDTEDIRLACCKIVTTKDEALLQGNESCKLYLGNNEVPKRSKEQSSVHWTNSPQDTTTDDNTSKECTPSIVITASSNDPCSRNSKNYNKRLICDAQRKETKTSSRKYRNGNEKNVNSVDETTSINEKDKDADEDRDEKLTEDIKQKEEDGSGYEKNVNSIDETTSINEKDKDTDGDRDEKLTEDIKQKRENGNGNEKNNSGKTTNESRDGSTTEKDTDDSEDQNKKNITKKKWKKRKKKKSSGTYKTAQNTDLSKHTTASPNKYDSMFLDFMMNECTLIYDLKCILHITQAFQSNEKTEALLKLLTLSKTWAHSQSEKLLTNTGVLDAALYTTEKALDTVCENTIAKIDEIYNAMFEAGHKLISPTADETEIKSKIYDTILTNSYPENIESANLLKDLKTCENTLAGTSENINALLNSLNNVLLLMDCVLHKNVYSSLRSVPAPMLKKLYKCLCSYIVALDAELVLQRNKQCTIQKRVIENLKAVIHELYHILFCELELSLKWLKVVLSRIKKSGEDFVNDIIENFFKSALMRLKLTKNIITYQCSTSGNDLLEAMEGVMQMEMSLLKADQLKMKRHTLLYYTFKDQKKSADDQSEEVRKNRGDSCVVFENVMSFVLQYNFFQFVSHVKSLLDKIKMNAVEETLDSQFTNGSKKEDANAYVFVPSSLLKEVCETSKILKSMGSNYIGVLNGLNELNIYISHLSKLQLIVVKSRCYAAEALNKLSYYLTLIESSETYDHTTNSVLRFIFVYLRFFYKTFNMMGKSMNSLRGTAKESE